MELQDCSGTVQPQNSHNPLRESSLYSIAILALNLRHCQPVDLARIGDGSLALQNTDHQGNPVVRPVCLENSNARIAFLRGVGAVQTDLFRLVFVKDFDVIPAEAGDVLGEEQSQNESLIPPVNRMDNL